MEQFDIWKFIHENQQEHPEKIIELSARVNGWKMILDTVIKHLNTVEKVEKVEPVPNPSPALYKSPEEVSKLLGKSKITIYKWLKSGKIKGKQVGNKWIIDINQFT